MAREGYIVCTKCKLEVRLSLTEFLPTDWMSMWVGTMPAGEEITYCPACHNTEGAAGKLPKVVGGKGPFVGPWYWDHDGCLVRQPPIRM